MDFRLACLSVSALAAASWVAGCSSSSGATSPGSTTDTPGASTEAKPSTLPDGCPANSGYVGDEMCLAAPAADKGFQLHYGPSDYEDPANEAPYILQPNEETNDCYYETTTNATDQYVSGYEFYMRPGSHHIIMNVNAMAQPAGFATCQANDQTPGLLGASQTPMVDATQDPAPENQGLAVHVPANSQAVVNFHVINTTAKPILREAWLNYFYIDASQVKGIRGNVFLAGGIGAQITPGTVQTYQYSCSPTRPVRILNLASHMHAYATRETMWKVSGGTPSLVYEGYDWANPVAFSYDTVHTNPLPDRANKTAGASTGTLKLNPGDTLQWECAVDNTSDVTLTFRNEVYTGQMCVVGGVMVPDDDPMNPYDFTCALN